MWRYLGTRIWPGGWICYNSVCSLFRYSFGMWRPWSPLFHMNLNMLQQANWKCENFLITTALMESTNTGCWTMCIFFCLGTNMWGPNYIWPRLFSMCFIHLSLGDLAQFLHALMWRRFFIWTSNKECTLSQKYFAALLDSLLWLNPKKWMKWHWRPTVLSFYLQSRDD